jgi:hypothetical protein
LGGKHAQEIEHRMTQGEAGEPLGEASVGEFDPGFVYLKSALAEHFARGLEHPECLPGECVLKQQNPRRAVAAWVGSHRANVPKIGRWQGITFHT